MTLELFVRFPSQELSYLSTVNLRANRWTWAAVSTDDVISSVESGYAEFRITQNALASGEELFITAPVLVSTDMIVDNSLATEVFMRLPEYLHLADATQQNPDSPLYRFINVLFSIAGEIDFLWDWIAYLPPDDGGDGTLDSASSMVNPDICSPSYLPWIGTLLGVSLISPLSGFTPWDNLANVDESVIPEPLENWDDWDQPGSVLDADNDDSTQWDEIETFAPESQDYVEFARWQVKTAFYGLHGGNLYAMAEAAKKTLRATQGIRFIKWISAYQGYGNDPWVLVIETLDTETPDASTAGQESVSLLKAVLPAAPAGMKIVHRSVTTLPDDDSVLFSSSAT